ncbi:RidA family protein [Nocardia sp. CDC159]|uniref:RidA family protein n=1 Tax=Nocardia pulmonis TaxID=2951408 RepID=A0A9X2E3L5_9NOCA|nr:MULTISPECIES: RidA family protein [Nocardia]MCM6773594.1 RidA family protein [Nocardia pulmonis]MCM6786481.1 RidA family protein [Nocardia sp. CDC159]
MPVTRINPDALTKPSGFAHATRWRDIVHLAGQTALTPEGKIVEGGIVAQFRQALSNVLTALAVAGGRPENLLSATIYLLDIADYQANGKEIGRIWRELAGTEYPAMAGIGVTALWQPEALIEIQAVAALD